MEPSSVFTEAHGLREVVSLPSSQWTMTHSFLASTGGFVFELDPGTINDLLTDFSAGRFLPPGSPRKLALTARGVTF